MNCINEKKVNFKKLVKREIFNDLSRKKKKRTFE